MDEDPQYYGSLQEKVEEIIEKYKQQRIEEKEYIEKMKQVSREIRNRKKKAKSMGFSDTTQLSFYNTLDAKTSSVEDEDLQEAAIRVSEIFEKNKASFLDTGPKASGIRS
ncbi:type I site-specific deoxyribonuclease, HsdR family protein [Candidatus Haloredivivus sp. G17]|nr:type I site-specific deoxyribonuclease, HsdR family protein [Candidatus Haloredivivus sp. G17]